ncbi:hypothetical protein CAOG_006632 [Capsaspora owczarzaki ATCC 30864]|uniref:BHLH domain-containing protein n=2 Tax=Capsaspora owczarzaki (strain ATCC 30864) TaxID=595528 RepID=A0A0D2X4L9_CAPO3|nr:hypothetical protein CAOG_006632 [Capsaspora owczarzaki ATCC 30864]
MPLSSSSSSSSSSSTIIPSSASSCKPRVLLPQPTITVAAPLQQLRLQAIPLHAIAQAAPSAGVCLVVPSSNTQPHPEPPVSYLTPISERSSLALAVAPPLPKPPTTRGLDIPSHSAASPAGFNEGVRAQSPGAGVRDNRVKLAHVASEKRRRDSIQVGFDELRTVVPDCSSCYSKASVLQRTLSYIRTFQRANGRVSGAVPTAPAATEDLHKQQPPLHHHGAPNQVADALLQQQNAMIAVLRASPFLSEAQQNELVAQFTAKSSVDLWANMPNNAPAFASGALRPLTPACSLSTASMSDDDDEPATPSSLSD